MANEITQNANAALTAWLEAEIIEEVRPALAAYPLVWVKDIGGYPTLADKFSLLPTSPAVAGAISDGTAMSNTALTPTSVTITAAGVGLGGVLTDFSKEGSLINENVVKGYFGRGVLEKIETDITATFTNFTTYAAAGTSGSPLVLGDLMTAQYNLQNGKAPGEFGMVSTTPQARDIRKAIVQTAGTIFANSNAEIVAKGIPANSKQAYVTSFLEVDIFQSPTCPAAGGDKVGLMFVKWDGGGKGGALGFVKKWDLRLETLRQPLYPGEQIAGTSCYGTALLVSAYGNKVQTIGS